MRDWAERKGIHDPERYCEIFVGRNAASGKKYHDWDHALMNAIREDWYGLRTPKVNGSAKVDRRGAIMAANFGVSDGTGSGRTERDITGESKRVA